MAKKQTRRSISVSRTTYERLKAYCETHGMSMSQFVETRVGDFLGRTDISQPSMSSAFRQKSAPAYLPARAAGRPEVPGSGNAGGPLRSPVLEGRNASPDASEVRSTAAPTASTTAPDGRSAGVPLHIGHSPSPATMSSPLARPTPVGSNLAAESRDSEAKVRPVEATERAPTKVSADQIFTF